MNRWRSPLVTLLWVAAATPLVAQQASSLTPQAGSPAQVSPAAPASAVRPGPTIRPEWRRVESTIPDNSASALAPAAAQGSHTITVTTLVLVLLVILAVLLIA